MVSLKVQSSSSEEETEDTSKGEENIPEAELTGFQRDKQNLRAFKQQVTEINKTGLRAPSTSNNKNNNNVATL